MIAGARFMRLDRKLAKRRAFEIGLHRVFESPAFCEGVISGEQPNWTGMEILTSAEKEAVRGDVREFAKANYADLQKVLVEPKNTSIREKLKAAFQAVLGA